jgi:hypothetical protein
MSLDKMVQRNDPLNESLRDSGCIASGQLLE